MSKYDPLYKYLRRETSNQKLLSFAEIEEVLGFELPQSAYDHPAWWANESDPKTRHVHCASWQDAGFNAFPNLAAKQVRFERL